MTGNSTPFISFGDGYLNRLSDVAGLSPNMVSEIQLMDFDIQAQERAMVFQQRIKLMRKASR